MDDFLNKKQELLDVAPQSLQGLMLRASRDCSAWSERDLGAILIHQLDAPLESDLSLVFLNIHDAIRPVSDLTFGGILQHPHPPRAALALIKDFAKYLHRKEDADYPEQVATVLYYASIAAATRSGIRITSLSTDKISEGCQWALKRTWLTPDLRQLFANALGITFATQRSAGKTERHEPEQ